MPRIRHKVWALRRKYKTVLGRKTCPIGQKFFARKQAKTAKSMERKPPKSKSWKFVSQKRKRTHQKRKSFSAERDGCIRNGKNCRHERLSTRFRLVFSGVHSSSWTCNKRCLHEEIPWKKNLHECPGIYMQSDSSRQLHLQ